MDLTLRTFQENGTTTLNSDFTVEFFQSGVLQTLVSAGVDNVVIPNVDDNSHVSVQAVSAGRHTFTKKFKVYFIDLDLSVKLPTVITNIADPNYLNPYPFFFQILNPCTYQVDAYNASSAPYGNASWYVNNELYSGIGGDITVSFPSAGLYQIKRRVAVEEPAPLSTLAWDRYYSNGAVAIGSTSNTVQENLELDTNFNVDYQEIVPEIAIQVNAPADILHGVTYYNRLEEVTVDATVLFTSPYADTSIRTLQWVVLDPDGNIIPSSNPSINLDVASPVTETTFTLSKRGDYIVQAKVTDECAVHIVEEIIPAYNFIQILPVTESEYQVRNQSNFSEITYQVDFLKAGGFISYVDETALGTKSFDPLDLTMQGIYKVTARFTDIEDNDREEITILHYYGELKDCLTNLTMNILCEESCGCNDVSSFQNLLEMYSLSQTYFMYLQAEYGFNNIYTALDNAKIKDLGDIDLFLKKLEKYCKAIECPDNQPCNCGGCANCLNQSATTIQIISGRTSASASATDCASRVTKSGCSSC